MARQKSEKKMEKASNTLNVVLPVEGSMQYKRKTVTDPDNQKTGIAMILANLIPNVPKSLNITASTVTDR